EQGLEVILMNRNKHFTLNIPLPTRQTLGRLLRWLTPNGGTLLLLAIFLVAQSVGAIPLPARNAAPAWPAAPTINYQGRLADSAGNPINDTVAMQFAMYDAVTDGSALWGPESHPTVPVSDGLFSVGLGSQTAGGIPTSVLSGDVWLEITVDGETLSPREQLRAVPYAMQANVALTVPDGSITTSKLSSGTVVNRYFIEWFGDETPCTTSSTAYVYCGVTLGGGLGESFPPVQAGMHRQYRLMVAKSDNLTTIGTTFVRLVTHDGGPVTTIYEFDTGRSWAWPTFQQWKYSDPITSNGHLDLQIRLSEPGYTMWLYRVWVMAEDVVP
ncbi:MAG: hypothetical protein JXA21_12300, partial [Anaerolineae bacterium]|nr:hypothetical protein [Anaerolineae bacterium]